MIQHQHQHPHPHQHGDRRTAGRLHLVRMAASAATVVLLLGLGAAPSSARPDAGAPAAREGHVDDCLLQRVGTQYVRCDVLTGNGVPAPAWIPER
ncbi:MAG TPA: hypothetical protein VLQ78_12970 [Ornithinibacter sp.]|nr:hypothetical protein [Ornithinibacter sp.]